MAVTGLSGRSVTGAAIIFEGTLLILGLGLGSLVGISPLSGLEWTGAALLWSTAGTIPLLGSAFWLRNQSWAWTRKLIELVDHRVVPLFRGCTVLDLLIISALAGLGEEVLFRGVIQTWVAQLAGPLSGVVLASLLFGLAHPVSRTYLLLAALIGLYLGVIYLVTGNLLVPILIHAAYDFLALYYLVRSRPESPESDTDLVLETDPASGPE